MKLLIAGAGSPIGKELVNLLREQGVGQRSCQRDAEGDPQQGRLIPEGLVYVNSWLEKDGNRCFQLMETNYPELFQQWTNCWNDFVKFEIIELGNKPNLNDDVTE